METLKSLDRMDILAVVLDFKKSPDSLVDEINNLPINERGKLLLDLLASSNDSSIRISILKLTLQDRIIIEDDLLFKVLDSVITKDSENSFKIFHEIYDGLSNTANNDSPGPRIISNLLIASFIAELRGFRVGLFEVLRKRFQKDHDQIDFLGIQKYIESLDNTSESDSYEELSDITEGKQNVSERISNVFSREYLYKFLKRYSLIALLLVLASPVPSMVANNQNNARVIAEETTDEETIVEGDELVAQEESTDEEIDAEGDELVAQEESTDEEIDAEGDELVAQEESTDEETVVEGDELVAQEESTDEEIDADSNEVIAQEESTDEETVVEGDELVAQEELADEEIDADSNEVIAQEELEVREANQNTQEVAAQAESTNIKVSNADISTVREVYSPKYSIVDVLTHDNDYSRLREGVDLNQLQGNRVYINTLEIGRRGNLVVRNEQGEDTRNSLHRSHLLYFTLNGNSKVFDVDGTPTLYVQVSESKKGESIGYVAAPYLSTVRQNRIFPETNRPAITSLNFDRQSTRVTPVQTQSTPEQVHQQTPTIQDDMINQLRDTVDQIRSSRPIDMSNQSVLGISSPQSEVGVFEKLQQPNKLINNTTLVNELKNSPEKYYGTTINYVSAKTGRLKSYIFVGLNKNGHIQLAMSNNPKFKFAVKDTSTLSMPNPTENLNPNLSTEPSDISEVTSARVDYTLDS